VSLTAKDIAEIARLLDESHFSSLDLKIGDFRLRIRRDGGWSGREADEEPDAPPRDTRVVATTADPQQDHRDAQQYEGHHVVLDPPLQTTRRDPLGVDLKDLRCDHADLLAADLTGAP